MAALSYGTSSVPRVDKIVGPGNLYVTIAKKLVSFDCAIDFLAGPTEVVIVHTAGAQTLSRPISWHKLNTIRQPYRFSSRPPSARPAGQRRGKKTNGDNSIAREVDRTATGPILFVRSREEALAWANRIAPEHITVERKICH